VVSTPLKNISQIGNLPQIGVKIKKMFEITTQLFFFINSWKGEGYLSTFVASSVL